MEARQRNNGSKERDKLPESSVQFPGRNTKQMDYVKEVESGINKQNANRSRRDAEERNEGDEKKVRGRGRRRQYRRTLERQRGSSLRMVEQPSVGGGGEGERRGGGRAGEGVAGEMDESCWGLKGASERVNLK